jgi:DNA (cytosine-5)-methyltransferase 1
MSTASVHQIPLLGTRRNEGIMDARLVASQERLLKECIAEGLALEKALEKAGLRYDDLRYVVDVPPAQTGARYVTLDQFAASSLSVPLASCFSGAGGIDLGFEAVGYCHLASVEINRLFCDTLRANRPSWFVGGPPDYSGDASRREETRDLFRSRLGSKWLNGGVLAGGPPCRPFSIAANQRFSKSGENFKRIGFRNKTEGNLLFDFIWLICELKPDVFLIENVPGLLNVDGGEQLSAALSELTSVGYTIEKPMPVECAHFLVPQFRKRVFIVGNRLGKQFKPPRMSSLRIPCFKALERLPSDAFNHITRVHKAESILRYMQLDFGERDHLGRVDRLDPNLPSKTVIAGGSNGGGRSHLHPHIPRTLSVRECARLQTFPDDYVFEGPSARQFTQVGNAVPPVLAAQFAEALRDSFFS